MRSEIQQLHLSIWPHLTGVLSMIGSGLIINQILRSPSNRKKVYHRLLLAMSICDLNTSFWYSLSTWPIIKGTEGVYQPSGTKGFCTAQGFFMQFGVATPLYNAVLAFYYLLTIRYHWKENKMKKAEKCLLSGPLIWASISSFTALGLNLFNNATLWCWIGPDPSGVDNNFKTFRWIFFYGPLWAAIISSGVAMLLTYLSVRQTEKASSRWERGASGGAELKNVSMQRKKDESDRKYSKQVSAQAMYYLLAFFFTWTPATVTRCMQMMNAKVPYAMLLLMAIFTPMQGFLNFLVYMRPRWIAYRKKHPEWGRCMAFAMIFRNGSQQEASGQDKETSESRGAYFSTIRKYASAMKSSVSRRSSDEGVSSSIVISEIRRDEEPVREDEKEDDEGTSNGNNEETATPNDLEKGPIAS